MKCSQRQDEPAIYQIGVKGILDPSWSKWFDDLTIIPQTNGETWLVGQVRDQAALHGLLVKVRDMGLILLSVERVDATPGKHNA